MFDRRDHDHKWISKCVVNFLPFAELNHNARLACLYILISVRRHIQLDKPRNKEEKVFKEFEGKSITILWHLTRGRVNSNGVNVSVVRALHWHRKDVGSIPAGEPVVDEFFSTVPGWFFDMCMILLELKTHLSFSI